MDKIIEKEKCVGCSACWSVCPKNAIQISFDTNLGFSYPDIDNALCVNCNLCKKVCPILNSSSNNADKIAYATYAKDPVLRENSSSGGIFSLLAETVLHKNGLVFGVAMSEDCYSAEHICVENVEELKKLRGSKYIQSNINDSFIKTKQHLEDGQNILFSGTPCQVAGLKSFLGKEYQNLLTVDFICHGIPSPLAWKRYIEYTENKANSKVQKVFFRNKSSGWKVYSVRIVFENGKEQTSVLSDNLFMKGFLSDLYLRPSCFNCNFKNTGYVSDITIADFWGIEKIKPDWNDNKGISLLISNSDKGNDFLTEIKEKTVCETVNLNESVLYNKSYFESASKKFVSKLVFKDMNKLSFNKLINKYCSSKTSSKITRKLHKIGIKFYD